MLTSNGIGGGGEGVGELRASFMLSTAPGLCEMSAPGGVGNAAPQLLHHPLGLLGFGSPPGLGARLQWVPLVLPWDPSLVWTPLSPPPPPAPSCPEHALTLYMWCQTPPLAPVMSQAAFLCSPRLSAPLSPVQFQSVVVVGSIKLVSNYSASSVLPPEPLSLGLL